MEGIRLAAVVLHAVGSISISLGLISLAVVLRRYWLRSQKRPLLFFKIPHPDSFIVGSAIGFLLLTFLFFLAVFGRIPSSNQWPKLVGISFLLFFNLLACWSLNDFNSKLLKRRKA